MCTIIPVSQLTMSEVWSSVQHLQVLSFCPDVVSNDLTSCVVVQRFATTTSTEELELIQIRHRDISTKNKTVTLLANILQRLTEQHVVLCSTKRYKTTKQGWFYCKGWCLGRPLHRFLRYLRLLKPNRKQCGCDVESCRFPQNMGNKHNLSKCNNMPRARAVKAVCDVVVSRSFPLHWSRFYPHL